MNRRLTHRGKTLVYAFALATALVLSAGYLWAAPPVPEPPTPTEPPEPVIDEDMLRLGEDYLDLIKELDAVLADFEQFYQETGLASLTGIAKSVKVLRESLKEDPAKMERDRLVEKLDDLVERIDTIIEDADEDDSKIRRRHIRELESFSEDLSDIRDEFDSEFSEQEFKNLLDGEKMAQIFEKAARQAEKAMKLALTQQKSLDSNLIIIPPVAPVPAVGKLKASGQAKRDYYVVQAHRDYDDSLTQTASLTVPNRNAKIELRNQIGGINVHTWNRSEVSARLTIGYSRGSSSSRAMAQEIHLTASSTDAGIVVEIEYPDDEDKSSGIVSSQLDVTVPAENPVKISNSFGAAAVGDLRNDLTVATSFGSVEAKRITGAVTIANSTGGVYVEGVTGKLTVSSSFGDMEVVGVDGPIALANSYATVSIRNSSGNLTIANSGAVAVSGHKGNVSVESSNGDVEISRITGDVTAANSFGGMQIEAVSGQVTAENSSSSMEIADVTGPVRATNRFGSIDINDAKASIRAESSNGDIAITRAGGEVVVINRFGKVTVRGAGGAVQIDNNSAVVDVSDVRGEAIITNQFGPVVVADITGAIQVKNQSASVDLTDIGGAATVLASFGEISGKNLNGPFIIDNTSGSVELSHLVGIARDSRIRVTSGDISVELPKSGGYNVDASTSWGKIETDLPMKISSGGNTMSGIYTAGSGYPTLTLKGENASITISTKP